MLLVRKILLTEIDQKVEIAFLTFIIVFFLFIAAHSVTLHQQFVYQAEGFLNGSVFYHTLPPLPLDSSPGLGGKYYWPLAPFPSVLFVPFVAIFGLLDMQQYFHLALVGVVLWLCFKLARKFNFAINDSLLLAFAFVFSSVYFSVVFSGGSPWQFATSISTALVLAAINEHFGKQRYWLIGIYLACVFATRFTAGLAVIYIILDILLADKFSFKIYNKKLAKLMIPIVLVGAGLLWLNYARTGNILDNGYKSATFDKNGHQYINLHKYGLFSIKNIATNVYYYFLIPPKAVTNPTTLRLTPPYLMPGVGLGFIYTSPVFLLMLASVWRRREQLLAGITTGVILLMLLSYYSIIHHLLGTYYLADILPFLYILLLCYFINNRVSLLARTLIYSAAILNVYLFLVEVFLRR